MQMRLNQYLAKSGLGSRRTVETHIRRGRVTINGRPVTELAVTVNPARDRVEVDGLPVRPSPTPIYLIMNKPRGYDVTRGGRQHHRRAYDLLPPHTHPSVQAAGRLDRNSTGLLLFTNDGQVAYRLTHPRFGCRKVYQVLVEGETQSRTRARFAEGVELEDGPARAVAVHHRPTDQPGRDGLEITMEEGRKHIVRRMCEALGHPVLELHRTRLGPLALQDLKRGRTRPLTPREVRRLKQSLGLQPAETPGSPRPKRRRRQ